MILWVLYSIAMKNFAKALALIGLAACQGTRAAAPTPLQPLASIYPTPFGSNPAEPHLRNLRMLTHAGENAEAYFSADGKQLIFQATIPGVSRCDQIFIMDTTGSNARMVSNGKGRTTCSYFYPSANRIMYASTHMASADCPPPPDMSKGYAWALYDYDIYTARPDGSDVRRITNTPGYDAEATISRDGRHVIFTSMRDGDLELYTMDTDGRNVRRLTNEIGYDGGAFYSADGSKIVYRAYHPKDPKLIADYQDLLKQNLVRPTTLDIFVMDADGSNRRQLTSNAAANFAPFFFPDGKRVIFSSNMADPKGRDFELYMINVDGTGLQRVTTSAEFDGFPMFSPDGRKLVFASNRGAVTAGNTNLFIADWVD
jgi:Tol biopolymer transport system component